MAVQARNVCEIGRRCHVYGKGIQKFGTSFAQKLVAEAASTSVQLVLKADGQIKRLASGILVAPNVVLCALHTLKTLGDTDRTSLFVLLQYEYTPDTAPPGDEHQHHENPGAWITGTARATEPQARVVAELEHGESMGADYALLLIKWIKIEGTIAGGDVVKPPRAALHPRRGTSLTSELLLVGHPLAREGLPQQGQGTLAGAGKLNFYKAPHPVDHYGAALYSYASFSAYSGHSGGGVFNQRGELVGVLTGTRSSPNRNEVNGAGFLDLTLLAEVFRQGPEAAFPKHVTGWNWLTGRGWKLPPHDAAVLKLL